MTDYNKSSLFQDAARFWLEDKTPFLKTSTADYYRDGFKRLLTYFAGRTLDSITNQDLKEYQRIQQEHYHATSINKDLMQLGQVLRRVRLWESIADEYRPLRVPSWTPPKVLRHTEEESFFTLAASNPEWELAYLVASITTNTSAAGAELRGLQLKNIDLTSTPPLLFVPSDSAKNEHRARVIPLNDKAAASMRRLVDRARSLGSTKPEHYVFPFRVKRNCFDPTRPASESWLRHQWHLLIDAAIEREIIPFRIKPHNFRHQAITKMLEAGVADETVRSVAGHVTEQMKRLYSHCRVEAKLTAVQTLDGQPPKKEPLKAKAYSLAVRSDSAIGSVAGLIKRLQRAGLAPDAILGILADDEGVA